MEHMYNSFTEYNGYKIIDCESCGFKHVYPLPSKVDEGNFYKDKYFKDVKPFKYDEIDSELIEKKKKEVDSNIAYCEIFDHVENSKLTDIKSMLDIGCGNDLLSLFFKNRGWSIKCVEPSTEASNYLKSFGLDVDDSYIEDLDIWDKVSFINVQFVLEHLMNPIELIKKAYNALEYGGILRISVPNDFSECQMAYKENYHVEPKWICLPDHINYFNFESLSKLLDRLGFKEIYRSASFPLEIFLLGGEDYYNESEYQKKIGPFINNFNNSFYNTGRADTLKVFYETLAKIGFGRSVFMYFIKK